MPTNHPSSKKLLFPTDKEAIIENYNGSKCREQVSAQSQMIQQNMIPEPKKNGYYGREGKKILRGSLL